MVILETLAESGKRQNEVRVTYFNSNGKKVTRVINTTMQAEEVKKYLPI